MQNFFEPTVMRHEIIQDNKFCLNKYFCIYKQTGARRRDNEKSF